jgi:hypothetical protein
VAENQIFPSSGYRLHLEWRVGGALVLPSIYCGSAVTEANSKAVNRVQNSVVINTSSTCPTARPFNWPVITSLIASASPMTTEIMSFFEKNPLTTPVGQRIGAYFPPCRQFWQLIPSPYYLPSSVTNIISYQHFVKLKTARLCFSVVVCPIYRQWHACNGIKKPYKSCFFRSPTAPHPDLVYEVGIGT